MKFEAHGRWTDMKSDTITPQNEAIHYCRVCGETFETTARESAHRSALLHVIREHDREMRFKRCDRYCQLRAQPEEQRLGRRLYGPGVTPPKPLLRAEQLLGETDDHF